MANIPFPELKEARKAAGMYQHQVATILNYSEDVIADWEAAERLPHPDIVSKLEKLYNRPGLWHRWMRHYYESYRERYPASPENAALALSMLNAQYEVHDMIQKQESVIRDALDGKIDDEKAFAAYLKEAKEAHAALGMMLAKAECKEGTV